MVVYVRNESGLLIGTATDLTMTTMNLLMKHRPLQTDTAGRLMQSPPDGVLSPEVRLFDWNPQPPAPAPTVGLLDTESLRNILSTVVHMMGGSVTIQPYELIQARAETLEVEQYRDPFYLHVKVGN